MNETIIAAKHMLNRGWFNHERLADEKGIPRKDAVELINRVIKSPSVEKEKKKEGRKRYIKVSFVESQRQKIEFSKETMRYRLVIWGEA